MELKVTVPEGDSDGTAKLNSNDTIRMESDEATHPLGAITLDCRGSLQTLVVCYSQTEGRN